MYLEQLFACGSNCSQNLGMIPAYFPLINLKVLTGCILFAIVTSITPGPNNIMLLSSGINFGFRRTFPQLIGGSFGFLWMLLIVSLGLKPILEHPTVLILLKIGTISYLSHIAWSLVRTQSEFTVSHTHLKPVGFWSGAALQWLNPKCWAMVFGFFGIYVPPNASPHEIIVLSLLFSLITVPCMGIWAVMGERTRDWFQVGRRRIYFNRCMALLLLFSLVSML